MTNIIPTNDIQKHVEDITCPCNPHIAFTYDEMLVIHNAFDKREEVEKLRLTCHN